MFQVCFDFILYVGIMVRVFATDSEDSKMVLGDSLLKTQYFKVQIKGKVEKSRERSSTLP